MCVRIGACENTRDGNQSRPVLTGFSGNPANVNEDGTCKYGHSAMEGECRPGWNCGYTFYQCTCVDEDTAADGLKEDQTVKLLGGIGCFVVGIGAICLIVAAERFRANRPKCGPKVVPHNLDVEKNGQKSELPEFSSVCPKAPAPQVGQQSSGFAHSRELHIDGLGLVCFALLAAVSVAGIVIVVVTLSETPDEYFNECGTLKK